MIDRSIWIDKRTERKFLIDEEHGQDGIRTWRVFFDTTPPKQIGRVFTDGHLIWAVSSTVPDNMAERQLVASKEEGFDIVTGGAKTAPTHE